MLIDLQRASWPLLAVLLAVLMAALPARTLAAEHKDKARPLLPGSIATLKAAHGAGRAGLSSALERERDNQTMTAVLDARRAMLAAANESRSARPHREDDAVGQGDGDGEADEQAPTAAAATTEDESEDQGDEHRPQNHR